MLERAAQTADDAAAEIRSNGVTLISSIQGQAAGFTGLAGTAFRNASSSLMEDMNAILQRLETLSANTRTSANRLVDQDESSAGAINRVAPTGVTGGLT
jgi:WXG100 family type VII secretion target